MTFYDYVLLKIKYLASDQNNRKMDNDHSFVSKVLFIKFSVFIGIIWLYNTI